MTQSAPPSASQPPPRRVAEREHEAVTVAMIVAPGVYARNRMFDFFRTASAKRARARAATVRGIVPHLGRAATVSVTPSSTASPAGGWTLRYTIPAVGLTRVVELTSAELAALRIVAERANVNALPASDADKDLVAKSLAKLMLDE